MPKESINETHDPKLESWVESANDPASDFPIQNLPLCTSCPEGKDGDMAVASVIIGDRVIGVGALTNAAARLGMADDFERVGFRGPPSDAHELFESTPAQRDVIRRAISLALRSDSAQADGLKRWLRPIADSHIAPLAGGGDYRSSFSELKISDYTDFYASLFHATSVGTMFRPNDPILPNYKHIPIAYHGRASTIVPSGTEIRRPRGQILPGATIADGDPVFGPCKLFDYELEVGFFVGRGNEHGRPISIDDAEDHILGMCLVNDWSARDIQKWEYQPLGPFLAKSFATSISPYIVTMEALAPFRTPALARDPADPTPLPYLSSERNTAMGGVDITLEVFLSTAKMREKNMPAKQLSKGSFKDMYWTISQMLAHHSSNGCKMQPGDLLASGTVSGPTRDARGCLLELTWDGDPFAKPPVIVPGSQRTPIELPTGEQRKFLADGDEIIIKGYCERDGFRRIGFGECRGIVTPAL